jgi:carbon monoxide dehydrogenase subunit G
VWPDVLSINESFGVNVPPEQTWDYMSDKESFSAHHLGFGECEEIDEVTSIWTVQIDLSMFSKQLTFDVEVLKEEFPEAKFTLDPQDQPADGEGSVYFKSKDDGGTEVVLYVESEASGRMDPFLKQGLREDPRQGERRVRGESRGRTDTGGERGLVPSNILTGTSEYRFLRGVAITPIQSVLVVLIGQFSAIHCPAAGTDWTWRLHSYILSSGSAGVLAH